MMKNVWMNWSRSAICSPDSLLEPTSETEILDAVDSVGRDGTLRVAGAGHSFNQQVESDDVLLDLNRYIGVEAGDGSASVLAGTSLHELGGALARRGFALRNMGDIDRQSVAGAFATGTHGTGLDHGVLPTQAERFRLATPEGVVECGRDTDPEVFGAAQVSLGALGVVTEVEVDVEPAYKLRLRKTKMGVEDVLDRVTEYAGEDRHFEFFWFPHTDSAVVKRMNKTDEEDRGSPGGFGERIGDKVWGWMCRASYHVPATSGYFSGVAARTVSEEDVVADSHRVFPSRRDVRFNEMEYGVPIQEGVEAFRGIREVADNHDVQYPVEFRVVAGDDVPLSPAYGRDTAFIAVHKYYRKPYEDYFRECEEVFRDYGGRPHWGKIHYLDSTELRELYPEWSRFQDVREELDPEGVFLNPYLERVLMD